MDICSSSEKKKKQAAYALKCLWGKGGDCGEGITSLALVSSALCSRSPDWAPAGCLCKAGSVAAVGLNAGS